MKKQIQKLQKDEEISTLSLNIESIKENPRTLLIFFRDYGENFLKIAKYIIIMKIPKGINKRNFWKFKWETLNYDVYNGKVWKLLARSSLIKFVININKDKSQIFKSYYNNLGHKKQKSIYYQILIRYY